MNEPETSALYDYDLPEGLIAQSPADPRDSSRLLLLPRDGGSLEHLRFFELPDRLQRGDLLVLNDTRVTARRLTGRKPTGGVVELLLMKRMSDLEYEAICKPAKRLQPGATVACDGAPDATIVEALEEGRRRVRFDEPLGEAGSVPLPPYYHGRLDDTERYQTVYARSGGSAAAPTAGLHFTKDLLARLDGKGIETTTVTLHIGMDTFRPMAEGPLSGHAMHGESFSLSAEACEKIKSKKGRIIAVGTTSVRVLEWAGREDCVAPGSGTTRLFITEGYRFSLVEGVITNFHLPRTTMLVMICAFAGRERVLAAYETAKAAGYRFLSFGDAMAIL